MKIQTRGRQEPVRIGIRRWWICGLLAVACGCSRLPRQHAQMHAGLEEESRALTTAVVDALQLQPVEGRDEFSETALQFARQDQRLEGLPVKPFDLPVLLGRGKGIDPAPNGEEIAKAREEMVERFRAQEALRERAVATSGALLQKGLEAVREENRTRLGWLKWFGSTGLVMGALVALCVFCPAAVPVVGRLLGWLVGRIPALSGAAGVVSVQAFDAVVRGIERAKADSGSAKLREMANAGSGAPTGLEKTGWVDSLHDQLGREMDASHKRLVKQRKRALSQV